MTLSIGTLSILTTTGQIQSGGPMIGPAGSALAPTFAISSETSLGWHRSAASTMALSYGTLLVPNVVVGSLAKLEQSTGYTIQNDNQGNPRAFYAVSTAAGGDAGHTYFDLGNDATSAFIFRSDTNAERLRIYSRGTIDFLQSRIISIRTMAASTLTASAANTALFVNEMAFTIQASGASLAINSGGTTWLFNSDASAKNT